MRRAFLTALALCAALARSAPALPLRVRVGPCALEAPAGSQRALRALAVQARGILPELEADLGARYAAPFRILLVPPAGSRDPELRALDAAAPPWAAGFLVPGRRVGAIRLAAASQYPYGTVEAVLAHEATHMLLHDAAGGRLPRWFEEGVAMGEERRWSLQDIAVLSSSLLTGDLPAFDSLDASFQASSGEARRAYAAAFGFVAWSSRRYGPGFLPAVLREARARSFVEAWQAACGEPLARGEAIWRAKSLARYRWLAVLLTSSPLWIGITLLALFAGLRRRARARATRARWAAEERAAREALRERTGPPPANR
ncbi:MAG: hypothetical protein HZC42_07545 [Candidatus Eisenbacteria bacterium]|nr:hypothetical protein [Candidatus Eisenbacteria bacterium]